MNASEREGPMKDTLRNELAVSIGPPSKRNWTHCGFARRLTPERATLLRPHARRLPMVEVDGATPLIGERGPVRLLDVFEGRRMLIAYNFMWNTGQLAPFGRRPSAGRGSSQYRNGGTLPRSLPADAHGNVAGNAGALHVADGRPATAREHPRQLGHS